MYYLTCLSHVKKWVNSQTNDDDELLTSMISAFSDAILSFLERPNIGLQTYNEYRDGAGNSIMMLRNWPAMSVSAVKISNANYGYGGNMFGQNGLVAPPQTIPAQQSWGQSGYFLQPWDGSAAGRQQNLVLSGYYFPRGLSNILITYQAGYAVQGEVATIPASGSYALSPKCPLGPFYGDNGPTYANGTALTLVTVLTGTAGQYTLSYSASNGQAQYGFNAADAGASVLLNYSYVPASIERACIQWVGEQYRYKNRIGETSKTLGGQLTAAYSTKDMPDFIRTVLAPYGKWLPL